MVAYYNEIDPHAAQHLRNLIDAGHIAPGVVDTRSIEDVPPNDLIGFNQCHFFAGIGGWSLALRRAGWPDSRPAWTASCPCQPFSAAGKGKGFADERHLWPSAHWLVGQRRPVVVFGEQSGSADANDWIDLVQADVEALGYAFGAVAFPSASVGAPHQRDRAYWVADADCQQWEGRGEFQPTGGGK
ncbi:DNA cytosine methyltransferase, partial [Klebsiella pneumoniae]